MESSVAWVDDCIPLLFYVAAMYVFWCLAHMRGTYWLWQVGWAAFTVSAIAFSMGRVLVILHLIVGYTFGGYWTELRNACVIVASAAMLVGALCVMQVYRDGGAAR